MLKCFICFSQINREVATKGKHIQNEWELDTEHISSDHHALATNIYIYISCIPLTAASKSDVIFPITFRPADLSCATVRGLWRILPKRLRASCVGEKSQKKLAWVPSDDDEPGLPFSTQ